MISVAHKEQRKRDLTALAVAIAIHLFILGGFLLSHFLFFEDVEEYRGPVLVKLGRADAPDEVTDTMPKAPESTEEEQSSTTEDNIESTTEEIKTGDPQETVQVDEKQSENAVERPVSDEENGDSGDSQISSEESSNESRPVNQESSTEEAEEVVTVTQGSEEGNAFETTYEATPGLVGRNIWYPIYLYMPLPQYVDKKIFDSIKADRQWAQRPGSRSVESKEAAFLSYYKLTDDGYYLNNPIHPDERPYIWSILEDGDYDLENAEYKEGKSLRPVVLTFTVSTGESDNPISDVNVSRTSGYGDIDDAVKYGFLKASFYNSSDIAVKGRFTYRF